MQKKRVCLVATNWGIATQVLLCLQSVGAIVDVIGTSRAWFLRYSRFTGGFLRIPDSMLEDPDLFAATISDFCRRRQSDIVLPGDELATAKLVACRGALSVPCCILPNLAAFDCMSNKDRFAEVAEAAGVPTPKTKVFATKADISLEMIDREFGYPVVIKPTSEGNGNGVVIAKSREDALNRVMNLDDYDFHPLLVQEFIPGYDIDISILAKDGEIHALAVQRAIDRTIVFQACPELQDHVRRLAKQTNFSGPAHFDARVDERDGSVKLIECNARFWASIVAAASCGLNFVQVAIDVSLGNPVTTKELDSGRYLKTRAACQSLLGMAGNAAKLSLDNKRYLTLYISDVFVFIYEHVNYLKRRLLA